MGVVLFEYNLESVSRSGSGLGWGMLSFERIARSNVLPASERGRTLLRPVTAKFSFYFASGV